MGAILNMLVIVIVFLISAIPLNLAVKLLGGKSSLIKAAIVNFVIGLLSAVVSVSLGKYAGVVAFIVLLFAYKIAFDMGWIRAFLVWIIQGIIVLILTMLFFALVAAVLIV